MHTKTTKERAILQEWKPLKQHETFNCKLENWEAQRGFSSAKEIKQKSKADKEEISFYMELHPLHGKYIKLVTLLPTRLPILWDTLTLV